VCIKTPCLYSSENALSLYQHVYPLCACSDLSLYVIVGPVSTPQSVCCLFIWLSPYASVCLYSLSLFLKESSFFVSVYSYLNPLSIYLRVCPVSLSACLPVSLCVSKPTFLHTQRVSCLFICLSPYLAKAQFAVFIYVLRDRTSNS